jgi:hypothetical protein
MLRVDAGMKVPRAIAAPDRICAAIAEERIGEPLPLTASSPSPPIAISISEPSFSS